MRLGSAVPMTLPSVPRVLEPLGVADEEVLVRRATRSPSGRPVNGCPVSALVSVSGAQRASAITLLMKSSVLRQMPGRGEAQRSGQLRLQRDVELVGARMPDVVADAIDERRD